MTADKIRRQIIHFIKLAASSQGGYMRQVTEEVVTREVLIFVIKFSNYPSWSLPVVFFFDPFLSKFPTCTLFYQHSQLFIPQLHFFNLHILYPHEKYTVCYETHGSGYRSLRPAGQRFKKKICMLCLGTVYIYVPSYV